MLMADDFFESLEAEEYYNQNQDHNCDLDDYSNFNYLVDPDMEDK
jgi:hypothetical protein